MIKKLGSIKQELAACRLAFKDSKIGDPVWCCHHEELCEKLTESAEARISYIVSDKPKEQQARRLREFRPIGNVKMYADYKAKCASLDAAIKRLHRRECPWTVWGGKTIFPVKGGS